MSDGVFALLGISAMALVIGLLAWFVLSNTPPCDGAHTGPQTYHGTRIECWHGDVIKVYRGRR